MRIRVNPMVRSLSMRYFTTFIFAAFLLYSTASIAGASLTGQTGLISMPDGRIGKDGNLRFGISHSPPYTALWGSISLLPRFELSGRYTQINGVSGFEDNDDFGDYKDKAFDAKLVLLREAFYRPNIVIGQQDFLGTNLFLSEYLAISKKISNVDITLGYGNKRIDGLFGGLRYTPSRFRNLSLVAEYDAYDYANDPRAEQSTAGSRNRGMSYGIEYRFGWIGSQLAYQDGQILANLFLSIPLMRREFVPKIEEPAPYTKKSHHHTVWKQKPVTEEQKLLKALEQQGFKNVHLIVSEEQVEVSLTHTRISLMGRAIGRAARTILLLGPSTLKTIKITYTVNDLAVLTYVLNNMVILDEYLAGTNTWQSLKATIDIEYSSPNGLHNSLEKNQVAFDQDDSNDFDINTRFGDEGHVVSFKAENRLLSKLSFVPLNMRFFFNDPSGAFHYDLFATAKYSQHFWPGWFLNAAARLTITEDVSNVTRPSSSLLPHVRSNIAAYQREGDRLRMERLFINKYFQLKQRVYSRISAGYYDEMFAGMGGQTLYLPEKGHWAMDLSIDWVKQREPGSNLAFIKYKTTTVIGSFHYRIPRYGVTLTSRIGRFLAKDEGVRFELKRRFRSGIEAGIWYTRTNGNDITTPGTPENPYYDKGIFLSIPLGSMLTEDTQARSEMSLSAWTRDVGQMVESPGDLYRLMERPLMLDSAEHDYLTDFER